MEGFINLLKPPGMTSHDVVDLIRRRLGVKRVGHGGTLDPVASGVLPLCLGPATRLASFLSDSPKQYRAEVTFGIATDTCDAEGRVLTSQPAAELTREAVEACLADFVGEIEQVPPLYSAVHRNGQRLYQLARQGVEVAPPPRRVRVSELRLLRFQSGERPRAILDCVCSPGTYLRSLARDLGQALGCGGYLSFLVRTESGGMRVEDSWTLEELEELQPRGDLERALLPLDFPLAGLPRATLLEGQLKLVAHGNEIVLTRAELARLEAHPGTQVRLYGQQGGLQALATLAISEGRAALRPKIVFVSEPPALEAGQS